MFFQPIKNFIKKVYFDVNTLERGHHKIHYRDVPIIKCPFDYVIYQMLISQLKPDLIIEIGTNTGGSALYFADLLEIIGHGEIHSIDINDKVYPITKEHPRIKLFFEGWEGYDLNIAKEFENILVIEDGSHKYEDSIGALKKFSHLIKIGSYFVVEDGIIDKLGWTKRYNGGPQKAISEFILSNDQFMIDRSLCDIFGTNATFNVNGYLKRIK